MTNQFVFKPKCHVKASNPKKNWFDISFGLKPSNSLKYIGLTVPPTYLQWMHNVLMRDGVCGDAMTPPPPYTSMVVKALINKHECEVPSYRKTMFKLPTCITPNERTISVTTPMYSRLRGHAKGYVSFLSKSLCTC